MTGPDGAPVDGALVQITGVTSTIVSTGPDGRYRATDMPDDGYRVFVLPPSESGFSSAWAPSERTSCEGTRFDVRGDTETTGADVSVVVGAALRGTILLPDGTPAAGADLSVVTDFVNVRTGATGPDGGFAIGGLVPGAGRMSVAADGVPLQFLGGPYSPTAVVPFDLVAGEVVDVGEVALVPGVSLSGTVYVEGEPATAGQVIAYGPGVVAESTIGADGSWAVDGLPPGEVTAWASSTGYATTYWPDADRPLDFLNLADGDVYDGMDFDLPPEAEVVGQLVGDSDWSRVGLSLRNDEGTVGVAGEVAADGQFRFGGLYGGSYVLYVEASDVGGASDNWRDDSGHDRVLVVPTRRHAERRCGRDRGRRDPERTGGRRGERPAGGRHHNHRRAGRDRAPVLRSDRSRRAVPARRPLALDLRGPREREPAVSHRRRLGPDVPRVEPEPGVLGPAGDPRRRGPHLGRGAAPDDDHDGMDDTWEARHGLDPTFDDSTGDPDHDGFVNLAEYLFDTNPTDAPESGGCGCGGRGPASLALIGVVLLTVRRRG